MTAAAALARAEAAGVVLFLDGGAVRWKAKAPPPPDLLADLRRHREDVAHLLARRAALAEAATRSAPNPADDAEATALAAHYAAAPSPSPYTPASADPLRVGLHAGFWLHRDAARLQRILDAGGSAAWCPSGALDVTLPDGREMHVSPDNARRLLDAGLLPAALAKGRKAAA